MDWNKIYTEKLKDSNDRLRFPILSIRSVVRKRSLRFKANAPISDEHLSELEYLILNYDYSKYLFNRYHSIISEECKAQWLIEKLRGKEGLSSGSYNIYGKLIPFYLADPNTTNPRIDKHFLDDQILLILGGLDHKYKRYRLRANYILEILVSNFSSLEPNMKIRIIDLISIKTSRENLKKANTLIFKNIDSIYYKCLDEFITKQIERKLVSPKMALVYLQRITKISESNMTSLKTIVLILENGEQILRKIDPAHSTV